MPTPSRTYRRTEAGRKAWDMQNTAVPLDYRRVLGMLGEERDFDDLLSGLGRYSREALAELLDELEQQGLVGSFALDPTDLDFTGRFTRADLRKNRTQ
jgi:hypothetical protein